MPVYNPSNEHCELKSALQDRYSDFYQEKPQRPAIFGLIWTEGPWPTLPNPHQMAPRDWFLKAKEIILGDRCQHLSKDIWAEIWGGYVVGKNCLDWMEERPHDTFSDWSKECLWRRG